MDSSSWTWRRLSLVWAIGICMALGAAWHNSLVIPGLDTPFDFRGIERYLRDPSASPPSKSLDLFRYHILRPVLFVVTGIVIPAWLYRTTKRWILGNTGKLSPIPRIFRQGLVTAIVWLAMVVVTYVLLGELFRSNWLSMIVGVPVLLVLSYRWLWAFAHPRAKAFDSR